MKIPPIDGPNFASVIGTLEFATASGAVRATINMMVEKPSATARNIVTGLLRVAENERQPIIGRNGGLWQRYVYKLDKILGVVL